MILQPALYIHTVLENSSPYLFVKNPLAVRFCCIFLSCTHYKILCRNAEIKSLAKNQNFAFHIQAVGEKRFIWLIIPFTLSNSHIKKIHTPFHLTFYTIIVVYVDCFRCLQDPKLSFSTCFINNIHSFRRILALNLQQQTSCNISIIYLKIA